MNNTNMIGWTAWCGDLKEKEKINGKGEAYNQKTIWFKLAVKRRYKVKQYKDGEPELDNKGNIKKDFPTDFFLINAYGKVAELIDRFVNNYEDKTIQGKKISKIVSRRLYIEGTLENYQAERYKTQYLDLNSNNEIIEGTEEEHEQTINATVDYDQTTINLNYFRLLDNKKKTTSNYKKKEDEDVKEEYDELDSTDDALTDATNEFDEPNDEFDDEMDDVKEDDFDGFTV